jgi:hypothetical protein
MELWIAWGDYGVLLWMLRYDVVDTVQQIIMD